MIDAIRPSAPVQPAVPTARSAAPASAPPPDPADTVALGAGVSAPGQRFWTECAAQGWIAGTSGHALSGPIGAALSAQAKADLRALTRALGDRGIALYRERTLHLSNADRFERLDADRAADAILESAPRFAPAMYMQDGEGMLLPVRDLDGLRHLDALHGCGDTAALERPRLGETLRHAAEQGVRFIARPNGPVEVPVYFAYEILTGREPLASGVSWSTGRQSQHLGSEQHALLQGYLEGDGAAEGLDHAELAADIKTARANGVGFFSVRRDPEEMSAFDAYDALTRDPRTPGRIGLGVCGVRLVECDRLDLAAASDALAPWVRVQRELLEPSGRRDSDLRLVMERLARVSPDRVVSTAGVLLDLFTAIEKCDRVSSYEVPDKVAATYDWLAERLPALDRPEPQVRALLGWIEACGPDEARKAVEIASDGLSRAHPVPADYQAAVAQLDSLLRGLRDVRAAEAALRVISVPVGAASLEQRRQAFDDLLALHPPRKVDRWDRTEAIRERADEAAADYLAVVAAAGRNEAPLDALVAQLVMLDGALGKVHQNGQARQTFEFIENGLHGGVFGTSDRAAVTLRFLEALVKTGDAESARVLTLRPTHGPADTVTRGQDEVVIGGIRVPVRRS